MKKKISILALALLFFTANTGLTLTLNFCEMTERISLRDVCEIHKEKVMKKLCCEAEAESDTYYTENYHPCCLTKIVDSSIKEDFISSKTDLILKTHLSVTLIVNQNYFIADNNSQKYYFDISPPSLLDNHTYLTNSILLI